MQTDKVPDILSYHYTNNGHCCIDGVTGEYVETDDNGEYFTDMDKAIAHRAAHIKKVKDNYGKHIRGR